MNSLDYIKEWADARRALMKASSDGQKWTPELVSKLTAAEDKLMSLLQKKND